MTIREVEYNGKTISYNLVRKNVKNINIRIKPDMSVEVSANPRISMKAVDEIIIKKAKFILKSLDNFKNNSISELSSKYNAEEFSAIITNYYNSIYKRYLDVYKIPFPKLRIKKMKSRWGSCNYRDAVITLSTNLAYCTEEQIYYVIVHEFAHLLVHNHSAQFYSVVERFCPDYKRLRKELNKIIL